MGLGFWSNLLADALEAAATVGGGVVGFMAAGPAGAVLGAGLARGIVSAPADLIRGETPSITRQWSAVGDGATAEMGGQVVGKVVIAPVVKAISSRWGAVPRTAPTPGAYGRAANAIGATREARVAELIGGRVSGDDIVSAKYGKTDIDVISGNGDLVMVGGPSKARDLGNLGRVIRVYQEEAASRGVGVKAYFAPGTSQNVIDFTVKRLGASNVSTISKE
jgi:hypothetical protein